MRVVIGINSRIAVIQLIHHCDAQQLSSVISKLDEKCIGPAAQQELFVLFVAARVHIAVAMFVRDIPFVQGVMLIIQLGRYDGGGQV